MEHPIHYQIASIPPSSLQHRFRDESQMGIELVSLVIRHRNQSSNPLAAQFYEWVIEGVVQELPIQPMASPVRGNVHAHRRPVELIVEDGRMAELLIRID